MCRIKFERTQSETVQQTSPNVRYEILFSQRIVDKWNRTQEEIASASNLSAFKKKLDNWMMRHRQKKL